MDKDQDKAKKFLNTPFTRRQAVKAGGIAAVGLIFAKPAIQTLRPRSAFAAGGNYALDPTAPGPTFSNGGGTGPTSTNGATGSPSVSGATI